ncbi:MAG: hypothetical protein AAFW70_22480 [Cyanobacteria bacterium J06635_10]
MRVIPVIAEAAYEILASSYADTQGRLLFENLTTNFRVALRKELQDEYFPIY